MIPTLASSFGFGSIGVQKDRLTSIPNPVILVLTCNDKRYIV
jgi:carbonic anhydrase